MALVFYPTLNQTVLLYSGVAAHFCQLLGALCSVFLAIGIIVIVRQPLSPNRTRCKMVTWNLYEMCKQSKTVTSELAQDPSQCPETVFKSLYGSHHGKLHTGEHGSQASSAEEISLFEEKSPLERARACGNWGSAEPSELFLQVRV